jgi:short-subunit dehydrogenase
VSEPAVGEGERARVVWVIGASSGIGREAARQLAVRGDLLVLSSRSREVLEVVARECRDAGAADVLVEVVDVKDAAAVDAAGRRVRAWRGRIDAVVDAAGVVAYGRFEDVPADVFDTIIATDVLGAANVARTVLPVLREQRRGTLLLVGSIVGDIAAPMMTPYVVSKHAVAGLGRQLAIENRDLPDVHVTVLSPGSVDTPIYRQAANYLGSAGRPPLPVDAVERVAAGVVSALDRPRDRVSVGYANPLMRLGFRLMPPVYDALVGPMFTWLATRDGEQPPTPGNVFEPVPEREAAAGGEGHGLRDVVSRFVPRR